jgi:murein DD-endopeptidase MepM/ murein hydrolase activator NlpD
MKKRDRKRFFSLIYVPDQERDPRSISMSYVKGRVLLVLGVLLCVHTVMGFVGYYEMIRFDKSIQSLKDENKELKARNKRINDIAVEFQKIRQTDEKIRKAFGGPLGLNDTSASGQEGQPSRPSAGYYQEMASVAKAVTEKANENLYFISRNDKVPDVPDNLPTYLPVPLDGFITAHFQQGGWYTGRSHKGIDIAAQKESLIYAAGAGLVLLADWTPDLGNMILISHGQGMFSYYGHAARLLVSQGTFVKKGQAIALLGSSGISSAPHLHFEIWMNQKPLDPETFLFSIQKRKSAVPS